MAIAYPLDALAYLDPGAGSMMLQGLLAVLAACATAVGIYWRKIKTFLGGRKEAKGSSASRGSDGDSEMK